MGSAPVSLPNERMRRSTTAFHQEKVKRILVVEDETATSGLLCEILKDWGCQVVTAANGREGLQKLNGHRVDGILLDLEMPVMDGYTMLDELRWHGDQTPVVVMSSGNDSLMLRKMLKEGAQGFLVKPFNLHTLRAQYQECFIAGK